MSESLIEYIDGSLQDADGREINPSNYSHDDVHHLNDGYVQLFGALENLKKMIQERSSEISDVMPTGFYNYTGVEKAIFDWAINNGGSMTHTEIMDLMHYLSPYLATREPVSVDRSSEKQKLACIGLDADKSYVPKKKAEQPVDCIRDEFDKWIVSQTWEGHNHPGFAWMAWQGAWGRAWVDGRNAGLDDAAKLRKREVEQPYELVLTIPNPLPSEGLRVMEPHKYSAIHIKQSPLARELRSQQQLAEILAMQRLIGMTYSPESIAEMQREESIAWCSSVAEALWYIETLSKIEVGGSDEK